MKLLLKKSRTNKHFGTIGFALYARLQVSQDELRQLDECNLLAEPVLSPPQGNPSNALAALFEHLEHQQAKLHQLIEGHRFECERVDELLLLEEQLTQSALGLERYLILADSFEQEQVIDLSAALEQLPSEKQPC